MWNSILTSDFADNQAVIYSFLDTARGEKTQQYM